MNAKPLVVFFLFAIACSQAHAQVNIGEGTTVVFATVEQAKEILTSRDDFVQRMSPFDRAARMKTDGNVSEKEYLEFVGENVLAWDDAEREKITSAFQGIQKQLSALALPFPKTVFIVKTTGTEEGGAPYTRANAIIFPVSELASPMPRMKQTICHELFHIMSRENPELREKLYAAIGFVKCGEVAFPSDLKRRKITNPDAPKNDHCIRLKVDGKECWAVPILFSSSEKYDVKRGGEFFNYIQLRLLLVQRSDDSSTVKPIYDGKKRKLIAMQQAAGFFEQVGQNTQYIIHPEEILADNFALIVLGKSDVRSPEILTKLKAILEESRISDSVAPADAD